MISINHLFNDGVKFKIPIILDSPSKGLSKEKRSEVVKKAKSGEDIGITGKRFKEIADKSTKKYGSKDIGQKIAAAVMWKNIKR